MKGSLQNWAKKKTGSIRNPKRKSNTPILKRVIHFVYSFSKEGRKGGRKKGREGGREKCTKELVSRKANIHIGISKHPLQPIQNDSSRV
jgi:hypothetical protein